MYNRIIYLKQIFTTVFWANFRYFLSHRGALIVDAFGSILWGVFGIMSVIFATARVKSVGSVSRGELILIATIAGFYHALYRSIFTSSIESSTHKIVTGRFDQLLLLPVSTQFLTLVNRYHFPRLIRLIFSVIFIFLIVAYYQLPIVFSFTSFILLLLGAICYLMIGVSIYLMALCLLLKNQELSNAIEVANNITAMSKQPPSILKNTNIFLQIMLIPLLLLAYIPSRALMGKFDLSEIIILVLGTFCIYLLAILVFRRSINSYVGSN